MCRDKKDYVDIDMSCESDVVAFNTESYCMRIHLKKYTVSMVWYLNTFHDFDTDLEQLYIEQNCISY